jgi:O-antigen/teichoic acid export membrane protein
VTGHRIPAAGDPDLGLHFRVARGVASNYAGQLVVLATAFVLTPVVLHHVGPTQYGLWVLSNAVAGYGGLLDLGMSSALQKYVAEYSVRGRSSDLSRVFTAALALYTGLGLAALAVLLALAPVLPDAFGVPASQHDVAVWLFALVGIQLAVTLPAATPSAILRGAQRFDLVNLLLIVATLVTALLTVLVLALGAGIVAVAAVGVAVSLAMQLLAVPFVRRVVPDLHLDRAGLTRRRIRTVFSFSASVSAVRVATVMIKRTDPIVIGAIRAERSITPFALAARLPDAISLLTNQFVQILLPLASELDAREERGALRAVYLTSTRIALALSAALAATIGILGSSILDVWVGEGYARYGDLVAILAAAAVVDTVAWPSASILTGMARHRPLAWMAIGHAILKVVLSVVLLQSLGLNGVALATLVSAILVSVLLVLPYSTRTVGVRASEFISQVVLPNIVPGVAICLVLVAARTFFDTDRPAVLVGSVLVGFAVYIFAYLRFSAGSVERRFYREASSTIWAALSRAGAHLNTRRR